MTPHPEGEAGALSGYPIPAAALDDRLGFVGTTGAGKTYTVMGAVERLLASGSRCVIIDPMDVFWGLRLTADGSHASDFDLPILGGAHGDLPLPDGSGALIGETIANSSQSCIVSMGGFTSGAAERRFMLAFLTALYRKGSKSLFHLILDEADLWAPQQIMDKDGGSMALKGMVDNIVRRGRVKGFVPWLVTQRPAVIDKSIMSMMTGGLVSMKLISPQDRNAVADWLKGQLPAEQRTEMIDAMPQLAIGEGIVWLPARGAPERAQFPVKTTFDSSRAPKRGEVVVARDLKPLDLGALKDRLADLEADTKANDPKMLKAEIARLVRENSALMLSRKATAAPTPPPVTVIANADEIEAARKEGERVGIAIGLSRAQEALRALRVDDAPVETKAQRRVAPARTPQQSRPTVAREPRQSEGDVPPGCAKPLAALAGVYPAGMTEAQWATAAGYKRSGGTWGTYKSRLRGAGLIEQKEGRWFASAAGAEAAGDVEMPPPAGPDLVRWWASRLPGTTRMAEALIEAWPRDLGRDELALAVNMSAAGGSFGTYLSRLAGPGLIERDGGVIRLSAEAMGPRDRIDG